jgi:integrase
MVLCAILLGGEAGLRRGELIALEQADVGPTAINVQRNEWEGIAGTTKGGKFRRIPMTDRLREAVAAMRHLRGKRLLWQANGQPVKVTTLQSWLEVGVQARGAAGVAEPAQAAAHLLLAPRDARRAREGNPGARRARRSEDDDALHAPRAGSDHMKRRSRWSRGAGVEQVTTKART